MLLLSACSAQVALAQFNVSGPGFLPDENGTNLDDPQANKGTSKVAAGAVIKDCAECPEMVLIPAGSFVMGSYKNADESPQHQVMIPSFLMGATEVTQTLWLRVMGRNPSRFKDCGTECSVENVSWDDVQEFLAKLSQKTGQRYRLPTEAEWEYATRAGSASEWSFGNDESKLRNYGWYDINSSQKTHVVGQKLPNSFGLFDVHGNVSEWTQDCWHEGFEGAPKDGKAWITACTGSGWVIRGGSWGSGAAGLRSAIRYAGNTDGRYNYVGFRIARDLSSEDTPRPKEALDAAQERLAAEAINASKALFDAEAARKEELRLISQREAEEKVRTEQIFTSIRAEMALIPPGTFSMGTKSSWLSFSASFPNEAPARQVFIRSFYLGKTEVTNEQWSALMGGNPSRFAGCGQRCPVERVSWDDAQQFIAKLNQKTGQKYRLPSEAEWEYAARGGTTTEWSFGNDESKLVNYAWYGDNSGDRTQIVGQKLPNSFGLFDMHGNVAEWTQDCWHDTYAGAPTDGSAWVTGCRGSYRVLRGGSWFSSPLDLRAASRLRISSDSRFFSYGFRLAHDL